MRNKPRLRRYRPLLLPLIAGALLPLAFAPVGFYWLAWLVPLLLLMSWQNATPHQAFWRGFCFGLGQFGVGVSWIYVSIHVYGNTGVFLASLITTGFVAFLSMYPALQGYVYAKLFPSANPLRSILVFPALWMIFEWLRAWVLTGFPWLLLAYSQTSGPLRGFVPLLGEYGTGFLLLLAVGCLFEFILSLKLTHSRQAMVKLLRRPGWPVAMIIMSIAVFSVGAVMADIDWSVKEGTPIKVSMIQANIPQDLKWEPEHIRPTLELYQHLTEASLTSQLIIWPEAAIPVALPEAQDYVDDLNQFAKQHHFALLFGIPMQVPNSFSYYNAMMVVGQGAGQYIKIHLVPFGEFIPLEKYLRGLMGIFAIPMSDILAGKTNQSNLTADNLKLAPFICYEIAYSDALMRTLPEANLLVVISNDAWFGRSFAPAQHLQIGQFRALQAGRPLLMSGNSGITAYVNEKGEILSQIPQFEIGILNVTAVPRKGKTPWLFIGNKPIISVFFLMLFSILLWARRCKFAGFRQTSQSE